MHIPNDLEANGRYRVFTGHDRTGLFSVVTVVLENLLLRGPKDRYTVKLGREYLYFDRTRGSNVWEYYFNQPKGFLSEEDIVRAGSMVETGFIFDRKGLLDITNRTESYEQSVVLASDIFAKQVGFNEETRSFLELHAQEFLPSQKFVTVHRRATDYQLHGKVLSINDFFRATDPFLDEGFDVFLATDSHQSHKEFLKRYGSRLHSIPTKRSRFGVALHSRFSLKSSPFRTGLDACLDAYLLSRGSHLIRTRSNLTTFSRILNPTMPVTEIDMGISYTRQSNLLGPLLDLKRP